MEADDCKRVFVIRDLVLYNLHSNSHTHKVSIHFILYDWGGCACFSPLLQNVDYVWAFVTLLQYALSVVCSCVTLFILMPFCKGSGMLRIV